MDRKTKLLNQHNNELDLQVAPHNQKAFTDIICYLRSAGISEYDQELVRQDLLEMILSAQVRGADIDSVLGTDYKEFCDNVIASLPPKTIKQKAIDFFSNQPFDFRLSVSLGDVISAGILVAAAYAIVWYLTKNPFEDGKKSLTATGGGIAACTGIIILLLLTAQLGRETLFTINIFVGFLGVAALYITYRLLERL